MSPVSKLNKRVLFITPQPFLANRGSPLRVKSEVEALLSLGYELDVLCLPFGDDLSNPGLRIYRSWKIPGASEPTVGPSWQKIVLDVPLTLKGILMGLSGSYDAIHGVEEAAFIAAIVGKIKKTPYVVDMHSLLPDQLQYSGFLCNKILLKFSYGIYNKCLRDSAGIIAVCKEVQEYAEKIAPHVACAQLEDLPLDSSWDIDENIEAELRSKFNLQDTTNLVYTGNFSSYQGIPLLLESFKLALEKLDNPEKARLILVGENKEELLEQEKKRAHSLGISDKVIFTGELPSNTMGAVMSLAHALVSPRSKGGNTPLKVYCYMASLKPLVATAISSHTQVLSDESAYLAEAVPELFSQAIANSLSKTPEAKLEKEAKAKKALSLLDSRFNKRVFTRSMAWLYERVTQAPLPLPDWEHSLTSTPKSVLNESLNSHVLKRA